MSHAARFALLAAAMATVLRAQTAEPPAAPPPAKETVAPAPAESKRSDATPHRTRAISPEVAAVLAATAPKFAPPPKVPEKKPEELPDLREIDKPKNQIIRLPKYIVREPRPPVFREKDINSSKGLASIAVRRYLSETDQALNRFHVPFLTPSNEERAMLMYAEDERLKNMADMADLANMVQKSDASSGLYIKREVDQTFMRTGDFGWQGGSPTKNSP